MHTLGISGDEQSDLTVHGGPRKAVYLYPSEHYVYWRAQLPNEHFPWGAFGENLTTEGVLESDAFIGDRLTIGSAHFEITQPRMPCYKLGVRFNRLDMTRRFFVSGLSGLYLSVLTEGTQQAGDAITLIPGHRQSGTIAEVFRRSGA